VFLTHAFPFSAPCTIASDDDEQGDGEVQCVIADASISAYSNGSFDDFEANLRAEIAYFDNELLEDIEGLVLMIGVTSLTLDNSTRVEAVPEGAGLNATIAAVNQEVSNGSATSLSAGHMAGIAIAGAGMLAAIVLLFVCGHKRRQGRELLYKGYPIEIDSDSVQTTRTTAYTDPMIVVEGMGNDTWIDPLDRYTETDQNGGFQVDSEPNPKTKPGMAFIHCCDGWSVGSGDSSAY
jgi:hypothetical protein